MMKQLWRKWYFWALLVCLPTIPLLLAYYILTFPIYNEQYVQDVVNYAKQQLEEMGPSIDDEFDTFCLDTYTYDYHGNYWSHSCLEYPQLRKSTAAEQEFSYISSLEKQGLSTLEEIASKGLYHNKPKRFASQINRLSQLSNQIHLSEASKYLTNNDLSSALEAIEKGEQISKSNTTTLIGELMHLATRDRTNMTLGTILDKDLSKEQLIEFNQFLQQYKAESPGIKKIHLLRDFTYINYASLNSTTDLTDNLRNSSFILGSAFHSLTRLADSCQQPSNKEFLEKYMRWSHNSEPYDTFPITRNIYLTKRLQKLARTEPELMKLSLIPADVSPETPPEDRIIIDFSASLYLNTTELSFRIRTPLTRTELVLAASAARLYYIDNGEWPDDLMDIPNSDYTPLPEKANNRPSEYTQLSLASLLDENIPYGPLHSGYIPVNDQILLSILHHYLPSLNTSLANKSHVDRLLTRNNFVSDHCSPQWSEANDGNQKVTLSIPGKFLNTPYRKVDLLHFLYQKQLINEGNFRYAKHAEVKLKVQSETEYRVYSDEELHQFGIQEKRPKIINTTLPEDYKNLFGPEVMKLKPIKYDAILELTLELPKELYAIWSVGPDGKNQNAEIPFSPTFGSYSSGDIIIFPGGL